MTALFEKAMVQSDLDLPLVARGKVRDIYQADTDHLLIVTTDRLSAFDVVFADPIPGKGEVLTQMSNFWFERFRPEIANHVSDLTLDRFVPTDVAEAISRRAVVVKKLRPLPIEAIVRGYIIGSCWKDYQAHQSICGIQLPAGLQLAEQLPEPLFTPSTKAEVGDHDENISYERVVDLIGQEVADKVKTVSLRIYAVAAKHARKRGIIIADTKLEFGLDEHNQVVLIDEAFTPDSSRFWPLASYRAGQNPESFDKQYVRDYLETVHWDKKPPAPALPDHVISKTAEKYREALAMLTT